jgi:hypothetical protein
MKLSTKSSFFRYESSSKIATVWKENINTMSNNLHCLTTEADTRGSAIFNCQNCLRNWETFVSLLFKYEVVICPFTESFEIWLFFRDLIWWIHVNGHVTLVYSVGVERLWESKRLNQSATAWGFVWNLRAITLACWKNEEHSVYALESDVRKNYALPLQWAIVYRLKYSLYYSLFKTNNMLNGTLVCLFNFWHFKDGMDVIL